MAVLPVLPDDRLCFRELFTMLLIRPMFIPVALTGSRVFDEKTDVVLKRLPRALTLLVRFLEYRPMSLEGMRDLLKALAETEL